MPRGRRNRRRLKNNKSRLFSNLNAPKLASLFWLTSGWLAVSWSRLRLRLRLRFRIRRRRRRLDEESKLYQLRLPQLQLQLQK